MELIEGTKDRVAQEQEARTMKRLECFFRAFKEAERQRDTLLWRLVTDLPFAKSLKEGDFLKTVDDIDRRKITNGIMFVSLDPTGTRYTKRFESENVDDEGYTIGWDSFLYDVLWAIQTSEGGPRLLAELFPYDKNGNAKRSRNILKNSRKKWKSCESDPEGDECFRWLKKWDNERVQAFCSAYEGKLRRQDEAIERRIMELPDGPKYLDIQARLARHELVTVEEKQWYEDKVKRDLQEIVDVMKAAKEEADN